MSNDIEQLKKDVRRLAELVQVLSDMVTLDPYDAHTWVLLCRRDLEKIANRYPTEKEKNNG